MLAVPHFAIGKIEEAGQHDEEYHHAEAEFLAFFHLGFARPGEEGDDVAGFLLDARFGAVGIGDLSSVSGGGIEMFRPLK